MPHGSVMLFNSAYYGVFLFAAYAVFWALRTKKRLRAGFLALASYGFYFYGTFDTAVHDGAPLSPFAWAVLCLGIIFVGSTLDFWLAQVLHRTEAPWQRKALLCVSVFYYLGILALFKYWDFAAASFASAARAAGYSVHPALLHLVLPFGISFFTFETMSYTIDVYRRELEPSRNYVDYLLFVSFFPHLVAGPIVRPSHMLPQLEATPVADARQMSDGLFLIAKGLTKKIAIGDYLAQSLVGRVFDNPALHSPAEAWVAVYAYAFQIYADFSGYTDVALGSAKLFGYELPQNFDRPYQSQDLQEFWRRWHISLSSWLRDYLYIPLGGSRGSSFLTYRNLMITMVLGGLWHGASWNFVIWGVLHGGALGVTRAYQRRRGASEAETPAWKRALLIVATFHYVCLAWVFFRAKTLPGALAVASRAARVWLDPLAASPNLTARVWLILGLAALAHFTPRAWRERARGHFVTCPAPLQGALLAACAYALHFVAMQKSEPFVYGQF